MSAAPGSDVRAIKGKKVASTNPPTQSGPTTFFIKSEREMEGNGQRGRKASRASASTQSEDAPRAPSSASEMGDSKFGVQSLADTISSAFSLESSLSRTNSNVTEPSDEPGTDPNVVTSRKRKAGNPVHPRILAAGQRIISAEHVSTQASLAASPVSLRSSESPFRTHLRRGSGASSVNLNSQPLTPLKMSPRPESAMPSTPRSGSPKSFRLSDEEGSVADETNSQAIQSSSGEEDEDAVMEESKSGSMPQLVMPSIAIPTRRPFTERGKRIGRLRVMVVGSNGIGKTSLIQSILRSCEDVVHVDPVTKAKTNQSMDNGYPANPVVEVQASTRSYPSWWTDFESRRMLLRRKSVGDGVLERNLCFLDTPGIDAEAEVQQVLRSAETTMRRAATMERMNDSDLVSMLSGEGGIQIDAVLWLLDVDRLDELTRLGPQKDLLRKLCSYTNVIPLIGRGDLVEGARVPECKRAVRDIFAQLNVESYAMDGQIDAETEEPREPYLVSSALSDDADTMDASVLMSSQYLQPLMPSELSTFVRDFFDPNNVARMRHLSATKFLLWRQENLGHHIDIQKQMLLKSPQIGQTLPSTTSIDSTHLLDEPSKVLVPYGSSSYFRSVSPSAASESSVPLGNAVKTSAYTLARYNEQTTSAEPFRQVRLAKWAQDLQRGLHNERKRYQQMYARLPSDWASSTDEAEKSEHTYALVTSTNASSQRPARGTLGGAVAVFDPRDPLGVLAFSQAFRRRGWFVLQLAGGCGLLGAVAFWVIRNWVEVQEWCGGFGQPVIPPQALAVPPPTRGVMDYLGEMDWRGALGWGS